MARKKQEGDAAEVAKPSLTALKDRYFAVRQLRRDKQASVKVLQESLTSRQQLLADATEAVKSHSKAVPELEQQLKNELDDLSDLQAKDELARDALVSEYPDAL